MDVLKISTPQQFEPSSETHAHNAKPRSEAASHPQGNPPATAAVSQVELEEALAYLSVHTNLKIELSHDEQTGSAVVSIFSEDGQRLLRQMPPEAILKIAENLDRGGTGGLLGSLV
jgi:uncharacterized FlaG/YvyC family protein